MNSRPLLYTVDSMNIWTRLRSYHVTFLVELIFRATVSCTFDGSIQERPADDVISDVHPFAVYVGTHFLHSTLCARPGKLGIFVGFRPCRKSHASGKLAVLSRAGSSLKPVSWISVLRDALTPCPLHPSLASSRCFFFH